MLIGDSPAFAHCTDNLTGTPPAATVGTNFTAAANNADGTSVSVLAAIAHDIHFLVIAIGGCFVNNGNGRTLVDLLVDPAGGTSWSALINDLVGGFSATPAAGTVPLSHWYYFPLYIKSGASLGVRARTAHSADITTGRVAIWAFGCPKRRDMWWCGSKVESLGINAASSSGTDVTPGASGTFGSWTTIGTSTGRYGAIQFGMNGSDTSSTALGYHWQIGTGSNKLGCSPTSYIAVSANEQASRTGCGLPIWCDIPSGTTIQARATASGAGPENIDVAVYGVH